MSDAVIGDDGLPHCSWAASSLELLVYHDAEWGRPVRDDDRVYEKLCLEGFQSGLSWLTILRKRDGFRKAFASFDPAKVARFADSDIERLVADPGIVRNRAKIVATITNAHATIALRERGTSLAEVMWSYRPAKARAPEALGDLPSSTPESTALSKELRGHGFAFVGPTTVYAAMQSLGVVNDHMRGCHWRDVVEAERRALS